jgi:hypothetical protein
VPRHLFSNWRMRRQGKQQTPNSNSFLNYLPNQRSFASNVGDMVADCISIDFDFCIELSDKKFEDYEDAEGDTK